MEAPFTGQYKPVQPLSIAKVGGGDNAGPVRGFMAYMGGLFVELAACYGIGEAYRILELWYCNTFGGPIFLGIQFVTDPTCPTDLPALSTWLIPILEGAQSY